MPASAPRDSRRAAAAIGLGMVLFGLAVWWVLGGTAPRAAQLKQEKNVMTQPAPHPEADHLVLEGVPRIGFDVRLCTLPGSVESVMTYLKEPVDYDTLMVVSGASFRLAFNKDDGGNVDLLYFSPEPQRRIFDALGFECQGISWADKGKMIAAIKASLAAGKPVIACGIVGPPEAGIVAGYEQGGETLRGHSYFPPGNKLPGYYTQHDWYARHLKEGAADGQLGPTSAGPGLIVLGGRKPRPSDRQLLIASLAWAIDLARTAHRSHLPNHVCGLAAYDALMAALQIDADYPKVDPAVLETRAMVYSDQMMMLSDRASAARYLRKAAELAPEAADELNGAAGELANLSRLQGLWPWKSHWFKDAEVQQGIADPATRRTLVSNIRRCRDLEARAIEHLEQALAILSPIAPQADLDVPSADQLTHGARWQVENIPSAIAFRAAMNVLGDDFGREVKDGWSTDHAYDTCMAASGEAFEICMRLRKSDAALGAEGHRSPPGIEENAYRRMLDAVGYSGQILLRPRSADIAPDSTDFPSEAGLCGEVVSAIARDGRPVIIQGLPKPGFIAVITGYEEGGAVLHGWSCEGGGPSILFKPAQRQSYTRWFEHVEGVIFLKHRIDRDESRLHVQLLAQAVSHLKRTEFDGFLTGPAMYEAWAGHFTDGPGEPADPKALDRYNALIDPYIWDLAERRHYARVVLDRIAPLYPAAAAELAAAAGEFAAIHDLMWKINRTGGAASPGSRLPLLGDAAVRKEIAQLIRLAARHDAKAARHLQKALTSIARKPASTAPGRG